MTSSWLPFRRCSLSYVVLTYAKLLAPFFPFAAERAWHELGAPAENSVHAARWPTEFEPAFQIPRRERNALSLMREILVLTDNGRRKSQPVTWLRITSSPENIEIMRENLEKLGLRVLLHVSGAIEYWPDPDVISPKHNLRTEFGQGDES